MIRPIVPMGHRILGHSVVLLLIVSSMIVFSVTPAAAAPAATCSLDFNYNGTTSKLTNVSCSTGYKVRPWIKYYPNDLTDKTVTKYGSWITYGFSSVSRPAGSFEHSGNYTIASV